MKSQSHSPPSSTSDRWQYLSDLLNASPDAMLVLNGKGQVQSCNELLGEMFETQPETLIGTSIEPLIPPRFHRIFRRYLRNYFRRPTRRKMGKHLDIFGLSASGQEIPVDVGVAPLHLGSETMALCSVRDISTRFRQEAALREREARFRKLMEAAPDGILVSDQNGCILQANPQACAIFGYSLSEMKRMQVSDLMPERFRSVHQSLLRRFLRDPKRIEMGRNHPLSGLTSLQREFPLELNISPIVEEDEVQVVSVVRDITLRRQREAELRSAQELAEMGNVAKSEFLSHMSHELRTPLNGILGYAQVLQQDPQLAQPQRRSVDAIIQCGDHLLTLINDVLDLSKIEAGSVEVDLELIRLTDLLHDVLEIIRPRAEGKGLSLSLKIDPSLPTDVVTDPAKLRQILLNLIGNSVKFTHTGGICVSINSSSRQLLNVMVSDTGIGMSEEDLSVIFDPFKQAGGGKSEGGTGLGLSICQRLAEALGGTLSARSALDVGSTFTLTLPLQEDHGNPRSRPAQKNVPAPRAHVLPPGHHFRILVADDRNTNLDILDQLLTQTGFEVLRADDGDTALEILTREKVDLVLMDMRMPRMNGIEAIRQIRRSRSLYRLKVIAVTASVFEDFRVRALSEGFDDFLCKPFRTSELMDLVQKHLGITLLPRDGEHASPLSPSPTQGESSLSDSLRVELREALRIRNISRLQALLASPIENDQLREMKNMVDSFDFSSLENLLSESPSQRPDQGDQRARHQP